MKINMHIHLIPNAWSEHGGEALWTGQKNILLSCPQCLDSMLAPGFWNKVYYSEFNFALFSILKKNRTRPVIFFDLCFNDNLISQKYWYIYIYICICIFIVFVC